MSYSFELLPDEPILIATLSDTFSISDELDSYLSEVTAILDSLDHPVYYITDISGSKVKIFQEFLEAINRAFRGQAASINHPNMGTPIIVSTDKVIKLGAKGLNSEIFGNISVPVFDTLDEA